MRVRKELLSLLLIAAGSVAVPVTSYAGVSVDIDVAPPAMRVETIPAPRVGFVWAPGYWNWAGGRHSWVDGHYIHERRGYHWAPDAWVQAGPHWHYQRGHWER
jgi:hypothetical protein